MNGTFYHNLLMLQPPYKLKVDEQGRPIYVFNVEAEKRVAA